MTPVSFLMNILYMASVGPQVNKVTYPKHKALPCDGYQAQFSKQDVMGTWYVVAVIPGMKMLPMKYAPCYKMEMSETDEAGVEWLVRKKIDDPSPEFVRKLTGNIIRQHFFSVKPFDVWSKGYHSARGCFRQLLSLEINNTNIADGVYYENYMQLHIIDTKDGGGPYLLQVLWDRLISAIVYRRSMDTSQKGRGLLPPVQHRQTTDFVEIVKGTYSFQDMIFGCIVTYRQGVSLERLEPVHEFLSEIRGYQEPPRICDPPRKPIPRLPFQRP